MLGEGCLDPRVEKYLISGAMILIGWNPYIETLNVSNSNFSLVSILKALSGFEVSVLPDVHKSDFKNLPLERVLLLCKEAQLGPSTMAHLT